jgi:hypothetical protein
MPGTIELILWSIFLMGLLKAYVLPFLAIITKTDFIWIPDWIGSPGGYLIAIYMGFIPFFGVLYFLLRGEKLKKRKPKLIHLIFMILMLFGAFFAPLERILIRGDSPQQVFSFLSDTLPSGLSFAFLIPFFKLEKEKRLLFFLLPFAFFYAAVPLGATIKILNPSISGLPTYEKPFWQDAWFWSDMIVNLGIGYFIFWALLREKKNIIYVLAIVAIIMTTLALQGFLVMRSQVK